MYNIYIVHSQYTGNLKKLVILKMLEFLKNEN